MFSKYLLTGASGFLGGTVAEKLLKSGAKVRCLVLPEDKYAEDLPEGAEKSSATPATRNLCADF